MEKVGTRRDVTMLHCPPISALLAAQGWDSPAGPTYSGASLMLK